MTRINVVPVTELCDQHLLAEHRELTRIPNNVVNGIYKSFDDIPESYRLGAGHVRFFLNKLSFLFKRYDALHVECLSRGFMVKYKWPLPGLLADITLWQDYTPTAEALALNRARIKERMPAKARFTKHV